uniref:Uncharacterized protein n=1 Tax=Aegilops tauschii TaxID=37682 RepID=M8C802_AEGTA
MGYEGVDVERRGAVPEQWSSGAAPEPPSGAAREAEAGRRHRWRDKQLEQEGDAELGWGLLGDAYDRCSEICALSL